MNFRSLLTLFALLCCIGLTAQNLPERAGNRAKDRAERRANNNVDRKVDEAVDGAFRAVGNLFKKKKKSAEPADSPKSTTKPSTGQPAEDASGAAEQQAAMDLLGKMMGGGKDWEPYTNPHTFSLEMVITETRRNGKTEEQRMRIGATTDRFVMVTPGKGSEVSRMILNTQDGMTTMISTDKKGQTSGTRLRLPNFGALAGDQVEDVDMSRYTFEKTGQRRTIDGYACELLIMRDSQSDLVSEGWVTKDLGLEAMDVFGGLAKAFGARSPQLSGPNQGFEGIAIETKTTRNGKVEIARLTDIRLGDAMDRSLLSTEGITIQDVGY